VQWYPQKNFQRTEHNYLLQLPNGSVMLAIALLIAVYQEYLVVAIVPVKLSAPKSCTFL